jgi:ketosteroid isomerase-like protein
MSQENVELIRLAIEAYGRGDVEAALRFVDPEVLVYVQLGLAQAGSYRGRESMAEFMRAWEDAWDEMEYEPEEWVEDDDTVVVVVRYRGRGKASRVEVDDRFAWRYEVRGDKVVGWGVYASTRDALEGAGLSE